MIRLIWWPFMSFSFFIFLASKEFKFTVLKFRYRPGLSPVCSGLPRRRKGTFGWESSWKVLRLLSLLNCPWITRKQDGVTQRFVEYYFFDKKNLYIKVEFLVEWIIKTGSIEIVSIWLTSHGRGNRRSVVVKFFQ